MIYGSVCSGIEAASVAWKPLGWRCAFMSEIEPFPRAVLAHHYQDTPLHGDFTTIQAGDYEPIDLLVGGTPCQSFSVAGLRGGLADDRGNLALEFLRLADRLRPRWVVWENVPGVLSSLSHPAPDPCPPPPPMDLGCDGAEVETEDEYDSEELHAFGCFLAGLAEIGYGFAYRVLDAQYFGLAQRRERVFVVGYLGDWRRAAAVLFDRASLRGDSPPSRQTGKSVAGTIDASAGGSDENDARNGRIISAIPLLKIGKGSSSRGEGPNGSGLGRSGDPMFTLPAGAQHGVALAFGGNNTGGPIDIATAVNSHGGPHGGPHGRQDFESETFIAHTLRAEGFDASEDGTGRGTPLVPVAYRTSGNCGAWDTGDRVDALTTSTDPNSHILAFAMRTNQTGANGGNVMADLSQDLSAAEQPPAVAFALRGREGGAQAEAHDAVSALRSASGGSTRDYVAASAVRRLTPTECERLQGFPDGWTAIQYRSALAADGNRYKALGNSMAVPCMAWLGRRIFVVEKI